MKKIKEIATKENINNVVNLIQNVMANKLVLVIFLIVQGITFIVNPYNASDDLARSVSQYVLLATGTLIVSYIVNKQFSKSNIITVVLFILSIICIIFPKPFGEYLKIIIGLTILINGIINIANVFKINKLSSAINYMKNSTKEKMHSEKIKDVEEGINAETSKITNSISGIANKISKKAYLYTAVNILFVFLGLYLSIFDYTESALGMRLLGAVLIVSGLLDLPILIKTIDTNKLLKSKNDIIKIIK